MNFPLSNLQNVLSEYRLTILVNSTRSASLCSLRNNARSIEHTMMYCLHTIKIFRSLKCFSFLPSWSIFLDRTPINTEIAELSPLHHAEIILHELNLLQQSLLNRQLWSGHIKGLTFRQRGHNSGDGPIFWTERCSCPAHPYPLWRAESFVL